MKKYKITSPDGASIIATNIRDGIACAADLGRINNLIADEEAAISAYDVAISETQDEECKKVFRHIKEEEVEHLEELKKLKQLIEQGKTNDSIVDSTTKDSSSKRTFRITYRKDGRVKTFVCKADDREDAVNQLDEFDDYDKVEKVNVDDAKKVFVITYKYSYDYKNSKVDEATDEIEAENESKAEQLLEAKLDRNNKVLEKVVSIKEK